MVRIIFAREFKSLFTTPIALIVITAYLAISGFFIYTQTVDYISLTTTTSYRSAIQGLTIMNNLFSPFYNKIYMIFSFLVPILTMRTFAEERRTKTYELMMSLPVSSFQFVMGKYLACLAFSLILLAVSAIYPLALSPFLNVSLIELMGSYIGLFLYIAFYTAVGIYFSTLTSNQIIAVLACYGFSVSFFIIDWLAYISPSYLEPILAALLLNKHMGSFFDGYVYLADVTLFISFTIVFIVLAKRRVFFENKPA